MSNFDIDQGFADAQLESAANNAIRDKLIQKMVPIIDKMEIDPSTDRASEIEAKMGILTTTDSLLKSKEASKMNVLKAAMSRKTADAAEEQAAAVTGILKTINPDHFIQRPDGDAADPEKSSDIVEEAYLESGDDNITENEMELAEI